jgi:hypothetical protein
VKIITETPRRHADVRMVVNPAHRLHWIGRRRLRMRTKLSTILLALALAPAAALAQTQPDETRGPDIDGDGADEEIVADDNEPGGPLPEPASDADPAPPVAMPGSTSATVVRQAGVGGQVGYGRSGVLELGGAAGFTSTNGFTRVSLTPSVGWFVADNFQISGLLGFNYARTKDEMGSADASMTSVLFEPSYHLPLSRTAFAFGGVGFGGAYVSGPGLGFAMAPRVGANFMVGRSGVLTPALSWQYTTHEADETPNGVAVVVSSAVMANVGYTVMW